MLLKSEILQLKTSPQLFSSTISIFNEKILPADKSKISEQNKELFLKVFKNLNNLNFKTEL
jgi:hypothetical protein